MHIARCRGGFHRAFQNAQRRSHAASE
jgi:hypothetical protein